MKKTVLSLVVFLGFIVLGLKAQYTSTPKEIENNPIESDNSPCYVVAGSIGYSGSTTICAIDNFGSIDNVVSAYTEQCLHLPGSPPVIDYQWQRILSGDWVNINGETSETLNNPTVPAGKTRHFRRKATYNGTEDYTGIVTLQRYDFLTGGHINTVGTVSGSTVTIDEGSTLVLDFGGDPNDLTFEWEVSNSKSGPWLNLPNSNMAVLVYNAPIGTAYYRRSVTSCGEKKYAPEIAKVN